MIRFFCVEVGKVHVPDILDYNSMRGFVSTLQRPGPGKVFALDCEMCSTTQVPYRNNRFCSRL